MHSACSDHIPLGLYRATPIYRLSAVFSAIAVAMAGEHTGFSPAVSGESKLTATSSGPTVALEPNTKVLKIAPAMPALPVPMDSSGKLDAPLGEGIEIHGPAMDAMSVASSKKLSVCSSYTDLLRKQTLIKRKRESLLKLSSSPLNSWLKSWKSKR